MRQIDTYGSLEYNLDETNPGKLLFPLHERTGDDRCRKAANCLMERWKNQPRTSEGGFWHKQPYPYQM
jgi:unsaturated rhamnogalacturonyl hydrolase